MTDAVVGLAASVATMISNRIQRASIHQLYIPSILLGVSSIYIDMLVTM